MTSLIIVIVGSFIYVDLKEELDITSEALDKAAVLTLELADSHNNVVAQLNNISDIVVNNIDGLEIVDREVEH